MADQYACIAQNNLKRLYADLPADLDRLLPGVRDEARFIFPAFGETCAISADGISLSGPPHPPAMDILISLYALNARPDPCVSLPFKAPYVSAFAAHAEQVLVSHVEKIRNRRDQLLEKLNGREAPAGIGGDFSLVVHPLPKIALCYIFYLADQDFPPSVTCLFSSNARLFLPLDALADTGEYTSRKIMEIAG